jgi:hypothetical protein
MIELALTFAFVGVFSLVMALILNRPGKNQPKHPNLDK